MKEIPQLQNLVIFDGEQAVTDMLVLAKTFGKRHSSVLRTYDNLKLECSDEFMRHNFSAHEYTDKRGHTQRSVTMTKDGFSMLATGFSGPKATAFMEAYIAAFDAMTEHIANDKQNLSLLQKEGVSKVRPSFGSNLLFMRKLH